MDNKPKDMTPREERLWEMLIASNNENKDLKFEILYMKKQLADIRRVVNTELCSSDY